MEAFERGLAVGAQGLELDVHLSRDGAVVVHHDRGLERTTNLTGPIAHRTADELARADAGYSFLSARLAEAPTARRRFGPGGRIPVSGPGH
jgi:glycerophosphoryl diester phosphodiesterase